jgi:hypothetical protein
VYRLSPADRARLLDGAVGTASGATRCWPDPELWLLPARLQGDHGTCLERAVQGLLPAAEPGPTERLDLDAASSQGALLGGWSGFERTPKGVTFVWAQGREVGVLFDWPSGHDLTATIRLWPHSVPGRTQRIRALVAGVVVGEVALERGPQEVELEVPASQVRAGQNLLVLQAAYAVPPAEVRADSSDRRPLSFAVDWIELRTTGQRDVGSPRL